MHAPILEALRRGAHAEALSLARIAVAESPHDAQAHALLAHATRASGDASAALSAINRAVLLAPESADLHFQRAGFLLGQARMDEAQAALSRALDLDPNQFDAYIIKAQMAIGRGDLDEAERLQRTAARIEPDHAWVRTIEGMVASRRGDGVRAQMLLTQAAAKAPNDPQVLYALGFAHLKQGQFAFAEQAFRKVIDLAPEMRALRGLLADVLLQQQRPEEARELLQPLLDDPEMVTPGLQRMTARLDLVMGRFDSGIALLRQAYDAEPRDPETVGMLVELWRRSSDFDDARTTLDAGLAKHPQHSGLWQMRVTFEPEGGDSAEAVITRWLEAMPDHVNALDAQMHLREIQGRREESEALAQRIIELEPGRSSAEMRVLEKLIRETPVEAVAHVKRLITKATEPVDKHGLMPWLGYAQDRAGQHADAVMTWMAVNASEVGRRWALVPPSGANAPWPDKATLLPGLPPVAYLVGLPGSGVERIAAVIGHAGYPLRADRFGPRPPQDPLQNPDTAAALVAGTATPEQVLAQWRSALPARGVQDGIIIDWLPFWDNALLKMVRPLQPEAILMFAVRDPRDMLLEWMAFGSAVPYGISSPLEAARWLAAQLAQMQAVIRDNLQMHSVVRVDHALEDPEAFTAAIGSGLGLEEIRLPPDGALGPKRFAFGHWREYAKPLAEPFALLADAAQALGYPAQ